MKITIGGSMSFAQEVLNAKKKLEKMGHTVLVSNDIDHYEDTNNTIKQSFEEELAISRKYDVVRSFFEMIAKSDAMLVVNHEKRGIPGYLGSSVLMEIGVAYYLKKKIYLLYPFDYSQNYALEVAIIDPVILDGDLSNIK